MYKETQTFRQPWLWGLLLYSLGVTLYSRQPVGIAVVLGVFGLFWFLTLETQIDKRGIAYRWLPFQRHYRLIEWPAIEQTTVRDYAAIGEFGGWGIRLSWHGMAHTVSGHHGIEIRRKGRKRIVLIGTQRPEEVQQVIEETHSLVV